MAEIQSRREPLLGNSRDNGNKQLHLLHPDCPGCKCAHLRAKGAPAPTKQLILLGFVILSNALPISVLYPFLYFMVRDFHIVDNEENIGYYAGWIGSSFMAGRIFTGMIWGVIADRYGRKPVMLSGIISVLIFNTLFGLSTNFWMALITRFCLGSFNGMLGTVKAYAAEICSEEHQAIGISLVGTAWGFGLIVGPALGGYLSQPALKYPKIFKSGTLFARYPYLLQALCVSAFAVLGLIMCLQLPETLHRNHVTEDRAEHAKEIIRTEDHDAIIVDEEAQDMNTARKESIFRNWAFMASTLVYCVWSLHDIAYTEIFSLWAVSPKAYGGLSFSSSDVGEVLAVSGFTMLIFQLTTFPLIAKWLGPIVATRTATILAIPLLSVYPLISKLKSTWLWVAILTASVAKYILAQTTFTGSFILINNAVKQHQRGAANGLSLSLVSIFKAIGPAGGGSIFAWCQTRQNASFLPGDQLVFFFLNVFALITVLVTFEPILPRSTSKPVEEDMD